MEWTRGPTIGRGSSATVSVATDNHSGQTFAVKSARLSQSVLLENEQRILSSLSCPQIVGYRGFDITAENGDLIYNLFMELAPGGSLLDAIEKHGGGLAEDTIRSLTRSLLLGLHYLHSNGIVHCDIKAHNILLDADGDAKIADLGCARRLPDDGGISSSKPIFAGTPLYMAPEVARGEQQGFPADVWALGCTIAQMATGRAPWAGIMDPASALYEIGFSGKLPEIPRFVSEQGKDFLSKCLERNPTDRWSVSQLLKHDFITEEKRNWSSNIVNVDTPTSVLDHGLLWNSNSKAESEAETTRNSPCSTSYADSPTERIKKLGQLSHGKMPEWASDDAWITVRSNDSGSREEENKSSSMSQECNLVNPNEPTRISGMSSCSTSERVIGSDQKIVILTACWREKENCASFTFNFDNEIIVVFASTLQFLHISSSSLPMLFPLSKKLKKEIMFCCSRKERSIYPIKHSPLNWANLIH